MFTATDLERARPAVYRTLLRMTCNVDDAEDATQTAMLRAWYARAQFVERASLPRWVTSIAIRAHIETVRARKRRREVLVSEIPSTDRLTGAQRYEAAVKVWIDPTGPVVEEILDAIECLPYTQYQVMRLSVQGLDTEEIAQTVKCPVGTVKSRLHRARLALA